MPTQLKWNHSSHLSHPIISAVSSAVRQIQYNLISPSTAASPVSKGCVIGTYTGVFVMITYGWLEVSLACFPFLLPADFLVFAVTVALPSAAPLSFPPLPPVSLGAAPPDKELELSLFCSPPFCWFIYFLTTMSSYTKSSW